MHRSHEPEPSPELLISAYTQGIFPMGDEKGDIVWLCPDPRAILPLDAFRVSKNLRRRYESGRFRLTVNHCFREVMRACADRPEGTWITPEIIDAFSALQRLGFAHSVETWQEDELVGGLYGVTVGGAFCGESMFYRVSDASKVALVHLHRRLVARGFVLLDVQFVTRHLARFGAVEIPRSEYVRRLKKALSRKCRFAD